MSLTIYGVHDLEGVELLRRANVAGSLVVSESLRDGEVSYENFASLAPSLPVVRLNWSHHGLGTIPRTPQEVIIFSARVEDYVRNCLRLGHAGLRYVIGNEPNHENEGRIPPREYAKVYNEVAKRIVQIDPKARIAPAAVAPWNDQTKYPGNEKGDWLLYFRDMASELMPHLVDAWAMHAYSNSKDSLGLELRMEAPFTGYSYGFDTFLDFLDEAPKWATGLPIWLTEINMNKEWTANGWFEQAYDWINAYNQLKHPAKIEFAAVYRFVPFDRFGLRNYPDVCNRLVLAMQKGYSLPRTQTEATEEPKPSKPVNLLMPSIKAGGEPEIDQGFYWDPRLDQPPHSPRAKVTRYEPKPGETYWALVSLKWYNEAEAQGKINCFVETLDESGAHIGDINVKWWWNGYKGDYKKTTVSYLIDFPMYNKAPSFNLRVANGDFPSDTITGMGLGDIERPDWNIHVCYQATFQRRRHPLEDSVPEPEPKPTVRDSVPRLIHPVAHRTDRTISQTFGVRPEYYSQFVYDGVPLKGHNGLDFPCPEDTPIVSVDEGVVDKVEFETGGFGWHLKVRHAWGWSLYAHMNTLLLKVGDAVHAGQTVGLSGNTGSSTGPHLHFGMQVNPVNRADGWGGYVDPLPYLSQTDLDIVLDDEFYALVKDAAIEAGIDPELLLSLAYAENKFTTEESSVGAMGCLQIMPNTWNDWAPRLGAKDPLDPRDNLRVGAFYLDWCIDTAGSPERGLFAYNWGIGNVLNDISKAPLETVVFAHSVVHGWGLLKRMGVFGELRIKGT